MMCPQEIRTDCPFMSFAIIFKQKIQNNLNRLAAFRSDMNLVEQKRFFVFVNSFVVKQITYPVSSTTD